VGDVRIDARPDDELVDELVAAGTDRETAASIVRLARRAGAPDRVELPPSATSQS
jgi:hypothetical protein